MIRGTALFIGNGRSFSLLLDSPRKKNTRIHGSSARVAVLFQLGGEKKRENVEKIRSSGCFGMVSGAILPPYNPLKPGIRMIGGSRAGGDRKS